ncbi:MAG: response regulator [Rhodoferax sp.]|nr:response regulator [Rhodoferax sp.]
MSSDSATRWHVGPGQAVLLALLIVALASAIRMVFFGDLGRNTAYLTYYPAVVLAALVGGLRAGLLATGVSALLCYYWIQNGILSRVETLALGTFILSCSMISSIAEGMRRAQARAEVEREKAQVANQAKSAFLASMNHELRTPLNAILGFTEILRSDRAIPEAQRQTLGVIHRSGQHLLNLINDVLDMARIDAGRMTVETSALDLHELLGDVVTLMRARANPKGLQLILLITDACPRFVKTDLAKLRQILINLIGNAVKFTNEGGVAVRVDARALAPDGWQLVIEVEDSGIGIAPQEQAHIYEPFVRVGNAALHQGTGLGLAITDKFVRLLGGHIELQSTLGKGTVFKVELPVQTAQADALEAPTRNLGRVLALAPGSPRPRLLIVEDQEENSRLLQQLLEPLALEVELAHNGREGVDVFTRCRPDLIWMDVRMPVMDGLEATREIRALPGGAAVKIIAVTASVFKSESDRILAAGMDGVIRKPYRNQEIYACLREQLGLEYVVEAPDNLAPATTDALPDPAALARLPLALRQNLITTLVTLDTAHLTELIAEVALHDAALGQALALQARQLSYSAMLRSIRSSMEPPKSVTP